MSEEVPRLPRGVERRGRHPAQVPRAGQGVGGEAPEEHAAGVHEGHPGPQRAAERDHHQGVLQGLPLPLRRHQELCQRPRGQHGQGPLSLHHRCRYCSQGKKRKCGSIIILNGKFARFVNTFYDFLCSLSFSTHISLPPRSESCPPSRSEP